MEPVSTPSPAEREIELKIKMNERRWERRRSGFSHMWGCFTSLWSSRRVWSAGWRRPERCDDVTSAGNDYTCPRLKRWVTAACLQRWRLQSLPVFSNTAAPRCFIIRGNQRDVWCFRVQMLLSRMLTRAKLPARRATQSQSVERVPGRYYQSL